MLKERKPLILLKFAVNPSTFKMEQITSKKNKKNYIGIITCNSEEGVFDLEC